jgi:hypothetical protein
LRVNSRGKFGGQASQPLLKARLNRRRPDPCRACNKGCGRSCCR